MRKTQMNGSTSLPQKWGEVMNEQFSRIAVVVVEHTATTVTLFLSIRSVQTLTIKTHTFPNVKRIHVILCKVLFRVKKGIIITCGLRQVN